MYSLRILAVLMLILGQHPSQAYPYEEQSGSEICGAVTAVRNSIWPSLQKIASEDPICSARTTSCGMYTGHVQQSAKGILSEAQAMLQCHTFRVPMDQEGACQLLSTAIGRLQDEHIVPERRILYKFLEGFSQQVEGLIKTLQC